MDLWFKFLAFVSAITVIDGSIPEVHEVLELEAFFGKVVLSLIFTSIGDIEFVIEIEVVGEFASVHYNILVDEGQYQLRSHPKE